MEVTWAREPNHQGLNPSDLLCASYQDSLSHFSHLQNGENKIYLRLKILRRLSGVWYLTILFIIFCCH